MMVDDHGRVLTPRPLVVVVRVKGCGAVLGDDRSDLNQGDASRGQLKVGDDGPKPKDEVPDRWSI